MNEFRGFIVFLKNPQIGNQIEIASVLSFLKIVWKTFLILVGIDIFSGLIFAAPLMHFNLFPSLKPIDFNFYSILKITLIAPVIEELIFRLPLRSSISNVVLSISILASLLIRKWFISNILITAFVLLIIFFSLLLITRKARDQKIILEDLLSKNFKGIFYFQALFFGFLHLTNYSLDYNHFYLFPFFIMNYIFIGCFWGYLRIRYSYGLVLCISSHILVNCIYCLIFAH
jgi:hypothetical protein